MLKYLKSGKLKPINNYLKQVSIVFFVLVLIYTGLRVYLNHILERLVIEQVEQFADKNYKLELGKIDIGWWAYNANIKGLKLIKIRNVKTANDRYYFTVSATHVKLKGLYLFDLIVNQNLDLRKLEIKDPNIDIFFNDTLATVTKIDTSFNFIKFKLSKIELQNVSIKLEKSSGEITKLKGQLIDYSFINELLQLKQINLERKNSTFQNFDFAVRMSHAMLNGFDLNVLMNESDFNYTNCKIDSLRMNLMAHHDTIANRKRSKTVAKKLKRKSRFLIHPISIADIQFEYTSRFDTIQTSAKYFSYNKRELNLEKIKLRFYQKHLIEAEIKKLAINGFDVDVFLEKKQVGLTKMKIKNPKIKIDLFVQKDYAKIEKNEEESLGYTLDVIDNFEIENGQILLKNKSQKNLYIEVNSIDLKASNLNPSYNQNEINNQLVKQISFSTGNLVLNFPSNLYQLKLNEIKYNLANESMAIKDIKIYSNYKKSEFHAIVKKQIAMINFDLKKLSASGININSLIKNNNFDCNEIIAEHLKVVFYKDKNIPLLASDYKKFPQELLYDLNYPITINKLQVKDAALISEILNPGAGNIAKLNVSNVQAEINHVDNQRYKGNQMKVKFEGRIADAGLLQATAVVDMYASDFKHTVHAEIGKMPFKYLNDFMIDFARVEISDGILDKAVIDITGNNKKTNCKLKLSYHDLNMDILRNQNKKNKRYRTVASILANSIIYNHNPEPGKPLRTSEISQEYISNKFVVGNWINVSLKAMLLTAAPAAANALQISNTDEESDTTLVTKSPNWLKRFIERKKAK
jgi:hypothetical protein